MKNYELRITNYNFGLKKLSRGFTLVELLIAISIMVFLALAMVSIFNSAGIYNKARDAQRKKDLGRIKVAFEEYFNDKGCYPDSAVVAKLNSASNCLSGVFSPWMARWPCDPNGSTYMVSVEKDAVGIDPCKKWYKVFAMLENKNDTIIPYNWSSRPLYNLGQQVTSKMANYGVSSSNVNWDVSWSNPICALYGSCYWDPDPYDAVPDCQRTITGCVGPNCYLGKCESDCRVAACN